MKRCLITQTTKANIFIAKMFYSGSPRDSLIFEFANENMLQKYEKRLKLKHSERLDKFAASYSKEFYLTVSWLCSYSQITFLLYNFYYHNL